MKRTSKFVWMACAALVMLAGCKQNDELKHHYDNQLFISASSFASDVRIERTSDQMDRELTRSVTVAMARPEAFDVEVAFRAAPELLDTYREGYYDEAVELLPAVHYDLASVSTRIESGKVTGNPVDFRFVKLDELDLTKRYVLPVTIASSNLAVLPSAGTLYFVFQKASLVNVVADLNGNKAWPEWSEATEPVKDMESFTMEGLVFFYEFNNDATSPISTIMGIEDTFLIRVGDSTIPKNQLQVAFGKQKEGAEPGATPDRGTVTGSSLQLKVNRWYHVAVTFDRGEIHVYLDGKERASGSSAGIGLTKVNFAVPHSDEMDYKPRCFWFGYSYDDKRPLNGRIAEARIWNRALSADEINAENHFYRVSPETADGLVAYWKFNDGEGKSVKDYGPNGYNLTADHDLAWVDVALPEEK